MRPGPAAADDGGVGRLPLLAGLAALGQHAGRAARVPAAGRPALAAEDLVARLQPLGGQDVRLLAVLVLQQGDPGRPVGVVLDADHRGPDVVLAALEVDDAVPPLVPAAAEPGADDPLVVAAALLR